MGSYTQGKYLLISRPRKELGSGDWLPYAAVMWRDENGIQYHAFPNLERRFPTEEEALAFGFQVVRDWIDDQAP